MFYRTAKFVRMFFFPERYTEPEESEVQNIENLYLQSWKETNSSLFCQRSTTNFGVFEELILERSALRKFCRNSNIEGSKILN